MGTLTLNWFQFDWKQFGMEFRTLWSLFGHLISLLEMYIIVRFQCFGNFLCQKKCSLSGSFWTCFLGPFMSADTSDRSSHTHTLNCLWYTWVLLQTSLYLHLWAPLASSLENSSCSVKVCKALSLGSISSTWPSFQSTWEVSWIYIDVNFRSNF